MRITGLTTRHVPVTRRGAWVFVEVQTDTGLTGTGEASQGGDDARTIAHLTGDLAPAIAGTDPRDVSATLAPLSRLGATRPGATALSAVEMALWDLAAQASGSPLARHLGGARRPSLWLYANINRSTWDRTPDGFAARARDAVAAGFDAATAPLRSLMQDALARPMDAFNPAVVRNLADGRVGPDGRPTDPLQAWDLLVLHLWHDWMREWRGPAAPAPVTVGTGATRPDGR